MSMLSSGCGPAQPSSRGVPERLLLKREKRCCYACRVALPMISLALKLLCSCSCREALSKRQDGLRGELNELISQLRRG